MLRWLMKRHWIKNCNTYYSDFKLSHEKKFKYKSGDVGRGEKMPNVSYVGGIVYSAVKLKPNITDIHVIIPLLPNKKNESPIQKK